MKWFKKKKKEEVKKLDFSGIKMKLNIRSISYYETVRGKSFFDKDMTEEDVAFLVFSMLHENNDIDITFKGFTALLEDERVLKWCMVQSTIMQREAMELCIKKRDNEKAEELPPDNMIKVTDIANYLIIKHGMDVRYVMNDMKLWELSNYAEAATNAYQDRLTEERLWTYLTIMPHVDGKKLGGPEKLLPFPWDDKSQNAKQKEFERHAKAATMFLKGGKKDAEG